MTVQSSTNSKDLYQNSETGGVQPNFLSWHYSTSLPNFIESRLKQITNSPKLFNVAGLLKNLFKPYKRLSVSGKSNKFGSNDLFDKITFNLTSIFVGASVRLVLILCWILALVFLSIFNVIAIVLWAIFPPLSLANYLTVTGSKFYENDIKDSTLFLKKYAGSKFFAILREFFDDEFLRIFESVKNPTSLGITSDQTLSQMTINLYKKFPPLKKYLDTQNIKQKEFELLTNYIDTHLTAPKKADSPPIGQGLSYGYTNTLDRFANELTSFRLPSPTKNQLLISIEKILTRPQKNNVLLVGEPGVGRHNTLQELSAAIVRQKLPSLSGKRIMLLDTISLASTGKNSLESKSAFEDVFAEAKSAGNIILAIDNIDRVASSTQGRFDLTDVLTAVLTDNQLPIIGITTPDEFNKFIRSNGTFASLFERVDVPEATVEESTSILAGIVIDNLAKQNVKVLYSAILEITGKSSRLAMDRKEPEKSIMLLQDAVGEANATKEKVVNVTLVDEILSRETKTPVGKIKETEAEKLKNLEGILHKRIVGQNEAIDAIAKAMRRARAEIESGNRPIGSFLFLGPTGVGKTETAKALAEVYFGSEERMVRLDMSEFNGVEAIKRLIGDTQTLNPGVLSTRIRENPYCLLLVDEFEKANGSVHNLFLQILDEGFLTDSFGKRVSFDNVIIIATSNAGAEYIRELVGVGSNIWTNPKTPQPTQNISKLLVEHILQKGLFAPELINRFDGTIVYHPLTTEQAVSVTGLMLARLANNLKNSKNITLEITPELAQKVALSGFDPTLGARPIRRLIADKIEDGIAKMIIGNLVKNGETIPAATLLRFIG